MDTIEKHKWFVREALRILPGFVIVRNGIIPKEKKPARRVAGGATASAGESKHGPARDIYRSCKFACRRWEG